jgi:acetyl-CoA synthetase
MGLFALQNSAIGSQGELEGGALNVANTVMNGNCLSERESECFWAAEAEKLPWFKKWDKVLDWQEPFAHWFVGGQINASYACLDVHVVGDDKNKIAILWEDESGAKRQLTYFELYQLVSRLASAMEKHGVKKDDVVVIYMPLVPEAVAAMLATARLGALHTVVFSGFGVEALRGRILDVQAKFVITADFGLRREKYIPLKNVVDKAIADIPTVENVVVVQRAKSQCPMQEGRDIYFDDFIKDASEYIAPVAVESNHPLFVLYTSGSTGKPKGILHSTGGYLTYVYSTIKRAFGINQDSIYWCTADIGWITGHSYVVYGPLMHGATVVLYDGAPDYPTPDVWWKIIDRYKVNIFYTAPTALRLFMKYGNEWIMPYNLQSLKVLGSVGEPINPQVWQWYNDMIGKDRCPVIDTWWQTETGGFMIAPYTGIDRKALKPGSAMFPMPGIDVEIVDDKGNVVSPGTKGFLVIKKPWPGMLIGFYSDQDRYKKAYWSRFKGIYDSGDSAVKDKDGCFWLLGRSDEVVKIAGHRIGTAEIETAVLSHSAVAESAAIGVEDNLRGETIVVFAVLRSGELVRDSLVQEVIARVHQNIGKFVVVSGVYFIEKLPKTRSGKIMRRVLKAMVQGVPLGDLTTIEDDCVIADLLAVYQSFHRNLYMNITNRLLQAQDAFII